MGRNCSWSNTIRDIVRNIDSQPHLRAPESASAFQQTIGDSCAHWSLRNTNLIIDSFDIWLPRWPKEKTNILHLCVFWGTGGRLHWVVCWNDSCTNSTGLWCSYGHKSPEWGHGQGRTEAGMQESLWPHCTSGNHKHTKLRCVFTYTLHTAVQAASVHLTQMEAPVKLKKWERGLLSLLLWAGWGQRAHD